MSQSNETSGDRAYPKQKVFTADGEPRGETRVRRVRCHMLKESTRQTAWLIVKVRTRTHDSHRELYPTVVPSFPSGSDKVFLLCF